MNFGCNSDLPTINQQPTSTTNMSELIPLPETLPGFLKEYLPKSTTKDGLPFVTLTYAASLDSRIAAAPGTQTAISHLETKTMTHYIRAHHDAILIGAGTVLADDPGLNCRWKRSPEHLHLIRPVLIDPNFKWSPEGSRLLRTCKEGAGLAPFVVVAKSVYDSFGADQKRQAGLIEEAGGKLIPLPTDDTDKISWESILHELYQQDIRSVMIEGGANVINQLLVQPDLVSSLIVTVGPVYLGSKGVEVSPASKCQLTDVTWWTGTQDSVLCARLAS